MRDPRYIGTSPLLWLVVLLVAFLVIDGYRQARSSEAAAKQSYVQFETVK